MRGVNLVSEFFANAIRLLANGGVVLSFVIRLALVDYPIADVI